MFKKMRYCVVHCIWFEGKICPMCVDKEPPYLRTRNEVADPNEWKRFVRRGWVKNG